MVLGLLIWTLEYELRFYSLYLLTRSALNVEQRRHCIEYTRTCRTRSQASIANLRMSSPFMYTPPLSFFPAPYICHQSHLQLIIEKESRSRNEEACNTRTGESECCGGRTGFRGRRRGGCCGRASSRCSCGVCSSICPVTCTPISSRSLLRDKRHGTERNGKLTKIVSTPQLRPASSSEHSVG